MRHAQAILQEEGWNPGGNVVQVDNPQVVSVGQGVLLHAGVSVSKAAAGQVSGRKGAGGM
jgi:hypothetical protein